MYPPEDLNALLRNLHAATHHALEKPENARTWYSPGDEELLHRMIVDAATEPRGIGVFMVRHEDGRLEYMIVRGSRIEAVGLAANFIDRQVEVQKDQ